MQILEPELMKQGRAQYESPSEQLPGISPFTREFVPAKVARISRIIYTNMDTLMEGGVVHIARTEAQKGMECRRYVNDDQVLKMVRDKLSIAMRENVYGMKKDYFKGGVIKAGWVEDIITAEDEDKVIYIKFFKLEEDLEMSTISAKDCVYIKC